MKKIGVSACFMYPDQQRPVFGPKTLSYLENDMARYLARTGVMPILIPDLEHSQLLPLLEELEGFIFQGGTDIAPQTYGAAVIPGDPWPGDPRRDVYELKIMDYAIRNNKPVLGICRGFQLLNVYFGGTLYQDIETHHQGAIRHRDALVYDQLIHRIQFVEGKLLERIQGKKEEQMVNSVHHQGIRSLGQDLEVLATCVDDGLIEAFHWLGAPEGKVLGVQWHPEFFPHFKGELIDGDVIYDHFLSFC